MKINSDLNLRAFADTGKMEWVASPTHGVMRKMLDRDGGEVARATSLVQFEAGSSFPIHVHGGGEEFFVMDGVFSDEAGDYPAGAYVRHPPGSSHKPFSQSGCILFVKLRQMHASDSDIVIINTKEKQFNTIGEGLEELPLYENPETGERVILLRLSPAKAELSQSYAAGAEFFVLEGAFEDENGAYSKGFWLRLPPGSEHKMRSERGSLVFLKTGHLGAS